MKEIINLLPLLGIAIITNILCGVYYNINIKKLQFDWIVFFNGIIKALIVGVIFIGVAYIFDSIPDLSEAIGITPRFIMIDGITLYTAKTLVGLAKILGVETTIK